MIVLTAGGSIGKTFANQFHGEIWSIRNLTQSAIDEIVRKSDVLIHNSANLEPKSLSEATEDNFYLTKRIVDTIKRVKPNVHFVYISSMSMLSDQHRYMDTSEMSVYAFSKYMGEIYCLKESLPNCKIVRFSTIFYGDAEKDGLSKLIFDGVKNKQIEFINGGEALRDFIPLEIGIQYLYKIATQATKNKIFNIVSGKATSFYEATRPLKNLIPDLVEQNKTMDSSRTILSDFSMDSLKEVGQIEFNLSEYVLKFVKKAGT